jgi:hypothetical protein
MNVNDWLAAYAAKLGVPAPTKQELQQVLDLAGEAAHSSQRVAAPVATWLAGKSGMDIDQAMRYAEEVGPELSDG